MKLESRWETDDLIPALRGWVRSLPLDDVRIFAACTETQEPFPKERRRVTKQNAQRRTRQLLGDAPDQIRRAYVPTEAIDEGPAP